MTDQQRDFFRLIYPPADRPNIKIEESKFPVGDLSEMGIKFFHPETVKFPIGVRMKGTVVFKDGTKCEVEGDILRVDVESRPAFTVVEFVKGIPMAKMLEEQRVLIRKYKSGEDLT